MKVYREVIGTVVLSAAVASGACNRDSTTNAPATNTTTAERTTDRAADIQRERTEAVADLNERVSRVEQEYVENENEVKSGARTATAGLREELREDLDNAKQAIVDLNTTTPENWWDRHEGAMNRTADDIEADVRRLAGKAALQERKAEVGTRGEDPAAAPFESRRDEFVADLRTRIDAMKAALENVKARGPQETELEDTRARVKKLEDDLERLRSASADDWWDVSRQRVAEYVDRLESSVERLDDDKPNVSRQ
jgi:hypothetical protein